MESGVKLLINDLKNSNAKIAIGLATDGDADRFGVVDENGNPYKEAIEFHELDTDNSMIYDAINEINAKYE